VAACGICGSDLHYIAMGGLPLPGGGPMALGHEFAGIVDAVGEAVDGVAIGQRVVVRPEGAHNRIGGGGPGGGLAPYVLVRNATDDTCLYPLPESLTLQQGALVEPLGVGMHAVSKSEARPGDKVVVFGAGPIGLASIVCLRYRGVSDIVAVDLSETRLALAKQLGARAVCNATTDNPWEVIRQHHGHEQVHGMPVVAADVYIETSGVAPVMRDIFVNSKLGTRIVVLAIYKQDLSLPFLLVMAKELTLKGSMALGAEFPDVIEMLASGRVDVTPMITHQFDFANFMDSLGTARQPDKAAKVMVTFPV
jgi:threonine dehydrogenase-like Zn-dependent dehydrogenase